MSDGNVVKFPGQYYGDMESPLVLRAIADQEPDHVFVICWPKDGGKPTFHSTTSDLPCIIFRLLSFIHKVYDGDFGVKP